jgi:16S rRNA (guanine966-N2)-methyltransferase
MRIVGGIWRGRRIAAPSGRDTRPTTDRVREAWMSAMTSDLPGARVLDLFAGSGALGLEALSRGAEHATFVENAGPALRVLRQNISTLGVQTGTFEIVSADALRYAEALRPLRFDVAFADPPYGRGLATRLVEHWSAVPFSRILCIEHAPDEPLHGVDPVRQRRYGDTVLTFLVAPPATSHDSTDSPTPEPDEGR